jgi:hypothetical protein
MYPAWVQIARAGERAAVFLRVAELGLVLLLFTDASRTDLRVLRNIGTLPGGLLSAGTLLTILPGTLVAHLVYPDMSIWEAGILGAILAPTDAGLGQVIVSSARVPRRIRQALNVEAGLNDGLSVPFLLFFHGARGGQSRRWSNQSAAIHWLTTRPGRVGWNRDRLGGWLAAGRRPASRLDVGIVSADRRGDVAAAMPTGRRNAGCKHVHRSLRRWPDGTGSVQGSRQTQRRVWRRVGAILQFRGLLSVRDAGGGRLATVHRGVLDLCCAEPDRGSDASGGDFAGRYQT